MGTTQNITNEQLAAAFQELSISERAKLAALLPENWFENSTELNEIQKQALDFASEKEIEFFILAMMWKTI